MTETAGLHWRVEGAGRGLVLIHGWALALDYWDTVVPLLKPHFRVLRFDRRGFGSSGGEPSLAADCADLFNLMDAAGMAQATVVGMSQGARVAVAAAIANPARISALILDGPPCLEGVKSKASEAAEQELPLQALQSLLRSEGEKALQAAVLGLPLLRLMHADPAAVAALHRCVSSYRGLDLSAVARRQVAQPVGDLQQPLLIINGERETGSRLQAGARLQQQVAGATRSVIAGAGHLAALDAPERYCHAIIDFLKQVE